MKNPIVDVLIFFIIGLFLGQYFADWAYTAFFIVLAISLVYSLLNKSTIGVFLFIAFIAGIFIININIRKDESSEIIDVNIKSQLKGTVLSDNKLNSGVCKYVVDVDEIKQNDKIYKQKCRVYVYGEKGLRAGDVIEVNGKLKMPDKKLNPSDFDNYHYFKINKISYYISGKIKFIAENKNNIYVYTDNVRNYFSDVIYRILPTDKSGIVCAMILGDKGSVDDRIYDLYKNAGVVHILAISGLHISIFAGLILYILNKFNKKMASIVLMIVMALYCFLTGCAASTMRAVLMIYVLQFGNIFYRKYNIIGSTAFACLILLVVNPYYIYDIGFQYSFGCVFTIGMVTDVMRIYNIRNKFINLFAVTFFVGVTSKIISVYHFYSFNLIDVISNMIIVPCVSMVMPLCLLGICLGCISTTLGGIAMKPVVLAFIFFDYVCRCTTSTAFSKLYTGTVPILTLIILFVLLILLYKLTLTGQFRYICFIITGVFLCSIRPTEYNRIDVLSAGKAECIVIRDKNYVGLVNGGKSGLTATGEKIILPYMEYNNIKHIDDIFITSSENYVIGGLPEILENINVRNIYVPQNVKITDNMENILALADENNVNINYVFDDVSLKVVENLKYQCYFIDTGKYDKYGIKIILDDVAFLVPFNISHKYEEDLYNRDIKSDILLLSKYGSKKANSEKFIKAVQPENAIVSIDSKNYNEKEVMDILEKYDINLYNTKNTGMITVKTNDDGYEIKKYLGGDLFEEYRQ